MVISFPIKSLKSDKLTFFGFRYRQSIEYPVHTGYIFPVNPYYLVI